MADVRVTADAHPLIRRIVQRGVGLRRERGRGRGPAGLDGGEVVHQRHDTAPALVKLFPRTAGGRLVPVVPVLGHGGGETREAGDGGEGVHGKRV